MNNSESAVLQNTTWQVEVGGQIYEADLQELAQWIAEGALQPQDKVRRGNLRWLEANKIPALDGFFNAKELGLPLPAVSVSTIEAISADDKTTAQTENIAVSTTRNPVQKVSHNPESQNFSPAQNSYQTSNSHQTGSVRKSQTSNPVSSNVCSLHPADEAHFVCTACAEFFCKTCPKSYGGSVKVCPACGEICKPVLEVQNTQSKNFQYQQDLDEGFGFADFGRALAYPFKFKFSLISGAILFMFFTLGQNAWALGGMFLIVAAIFCRMLANTLSFGILANTVENFSHGKIDRNFMPPFEDFNLWDDVVHPFFLSIGTYLVSFGLLIVIIIGGIYFARNSVSDVSNSSNIARTLANINHTQTNANQKTEQGVMTVEEAQASRENDAEKFGRLEKQIKLAQSQAQQETTAEAAPETGKFFANIFKHGKLFIIGIFLALAWGVFYFPAACAVAGYTRSFAATLNPFVGLDTIKRLGFDYVKILFFSFLILIFAGIINYFLSVILSPLDLPQIGNIAATAVGSLFVFYFFIVFSVTLGCALYKNSDKLDFQKS